MRALVRKMLLYFLDYGSAAAPQTNPAELLDALARSVKS